MRQDAGPASVAELQQRVQELESVVRQLQANRPPAAPAPVLGAAANPASPGAAGDPPATLPLAGASGANLPPNTAQASAILSPNAPGGNTTTASGPYFVGWQEGFFLRSPDGNSQLRITGQLQSDFRGFFDPVDTSTTANSNVAGSPTTGSVDSFLIRRARLGIEADVAKYYEFRLLPDFAGSNLSKSITDAYMNVHYWNEFQFETGKFKQPFSYEDLIQDRYVPTLERSMMDQLVPQRDEGVMIHGVRLLGGRFNYAVAVSNGDPNDSTIDNNNHKDFNGRIVFRPFNTPDGCEVVRHLSFGLSGGVGVENEALSTTSSTPPILTTPATVTWFAFNTGVSATGVRDRISPELTYFYHSLGFAAQYYQQDQLFSKNAPPVDVSFNGYYFLATYLITGEWRTDYSEQIVPLHPFDPSAPLASPGAWELVGRVDRLVVGQSAFAGKLANDTGSSNVSSPECIETTTGFNWYLNKWVRAQLNWEHATFESPIKIGNMARPLSAEDAIYTRFQVIF